MQLRDHATIRPSSIHQDDVLRDLGDDYLYLDAVRFVRRVKKGPLAETSPMLNDVSGVPSWGKVNQGMLKMYCAEVLGKLPIMQHFLFGTLLRFVPGAGAAAADSTRVPPEEDSRGAPHAMGPPPPRFLKPRPPVGLAAPGPVGAHQQQWRAEAGEEGAGAMLQSSGVRDLEPDAR